jgi:hypothetical protein
MDKYISRKERARRLGNTIDYYIQQLKKVDSLLQINHLINCINYSDFYKLRNELNEIEKSYNRTNLKKTRKGKDVAHCCATLLQMEPWNGEILEIEKKDLVIKTLERFLGDLQSLQFVDFYGKKVK